MKRLFLISSLFICQFTFGQIDYTTVMFSKGLPNQIKFMWDKAEYAQINVGNYYKNLYLICKDTTSFNSSMYFSLIDNNGSFSLTRADLKQVNNNEYSTQLMLKTTSEDELTTLNIIIYPRKRIVEYAWGDSATGYSSKPIVIKEYKLKVGKMFPSLSLESAKGIVDLDKIKDKIIVINWWATSCVPCVAEIPGLNKLVEKYKDKPVEFLSIIWDKENLEKFLKDHPFDYRQLYGNVAAEKLLGGAFPRNIILDKKHKIIYNKLGAIPDTWEVLDKIIAENL